jgi:hypothetical protein
MRLSLMKGAHADLSSTAWQEIGVKPSFGLSGITALDLPLQVRHADPRDKKPLSVVFSAGHGLQREHKARNGNVETLGAREFAGRHCSHVLYQGTTGRAGKQRT